MPVSYSMAADFAASGRGHQLDSVEFQGGDGRLLLGNHPVALGDPGVLLHSIALKLPQGLGLDHNLGRHFSFSRHRLILNKEGFPYKDNRRFQ
jgi:hypothetical protein